MTLKKINKTISCTGLIIILLLITFCEKPERAVQFSTFAVLEVDITYTTVILKGEVTDLGSKSIEDHGILISESTMPRLENSRIESLGLVNSKGPFQVGVTGLKRNTLYYFRAFVTVDGTDIFSEQVFSFRTKDTETPSVSTGTITDITMTSAASSGNVLADGGESVIRRGLCWGASAEPTLSNCVDTTVNGSGIGPFNAAMKELTPGTKYYVRAYAVNAKGTSYSTADSIFTTHNLPQVMTEIVTNVTNTGSTCGGTVTSEGGVTVTARGVIWGASANPTLALPSSSSDGTGAGNFVSTLSGLTPGTSYFIRAYATNKYGTTYGNERQFTATKPPLSVTSSATLAGNSTATLNGSVTANNFATTVTFEYGTTTSYGSSVDAVPGVVNGSTVTLVSGNLSLLNPGIEYHFRLKAVNEGGTAYGEDMTFITTQSPVAVTEAASEVVFTSATLNGNVNPRNSSTSVSFEYGLTTSYGNNSPATPGTISGNTPTTVNTNLTSLAKGILYHYRLKAVSSGGTSYGADMTFSTEMPPAASTVTASATSVTTSGAVLNGSVNANGFVATVTFEYGLTTTYGNSIPATPGTIDGNSVNDVNAFLTGLTQGTTYHYRILSINEGGTSYGDDMTFTTTVPPAAICITGPATSVATNSATLGGKVNANGFSTAVSFEYGPTTSYGNTISATPGTVNGNTLTDISAPLMGLTAGTTYHYRIKSVNEAGSAYGDDITFTTTQPPSASVLPASSVTASSAILNGAVNPNGLSTTVTFEYGTSTSYGTSITATQSPVSGSIPVNVSVTISALTEGTTYHYRIKAENSNGTVSSSDLTFKTVSPPNVTTLPASALSNAGATLNGHVNPGGLSTTVQFEYGLTTGYGQVAPAIPDPTNGEINISVYGNITGLSQGTTYHYRIKATNASGTRYGGDQTFTTLQPPISSTLNASNITANSATLNGTINANNSNTSVSFEYGYTSTYGSAVSGTPSEVTGNSITNIGATITGLTPNTEYHFLIKAQSAGGTSYGSDILFNTTSSSSTVTDYDGNVYNTVSVGDLKFMQQDLKTNHYSNGDVVALVSGNEYALLYSWSTAGDTRNICPVGWHVPTREEWEFVQSYFGGWSVAGGKLKEAGTLHWSTPNTGADNSSGFTALPAGSAKDGINNYHQGLMELWWTSENGLSAYLSHDNSSFIIGGLPYAWPYFNFVGRSIRCAEGSNPIARADAPNRIAVTKATLHGSVNANGLSTVAKFQYGTSPGAYDYTIPASESPASGTSVTNINLDITGLSPGTTYYFRAVAENSAGTNYSPDVQFTTNAISTDYDGNTYNPLYIGTQTWLQENLKTTHFNNGDLIPEISDGSSWSSLITPAYSSYNNDPDKLNTYGRLYNYYTVSDSRNVCPTGFHVPTKDEWTTLINYLVSNAGGKLKESGLDHWVSPNTGADNSTGFTALPGGSRTSAGVFQNLGLNGYFATSSLNSSLWYNLVLYFNSLGNTFGSSSKNSGFSVRCIKD